jgi:hypothetical protein
MARGGMEVELLLHMAGVLDFKAKYSKVQEAFDQVCAKRHKSATRLRAASILGTNKNKYLISN